MKTTRDLEEMRDVLNEARMSLNVLLRKKNRHTISQSCK